MTAGRPTLMAAGVVALATFAVNLLITAPLFVFSEARYYMLWPQPGGLTRFFLAPELQWGSGRQLGIAAFQVTGSVCGVDAGCVNASTALLVAIAAGVLLIHTRQITNSLWIAVVVTCLWVLSPAVLGISLWQATRFDLLAFIVALSASAIWWHVLGRSWRPRWAAVAFAIGSALLYAIAFNAKEITYYLVGVLPLLAVTRGCGVPGRVRRNLTASALPLLYALVFIGVALHNIEPGYAGSTGGNDVAASAFELVRQGVGLGQSYMGIWQVSPMFDSLLRATKVGYLLTAAAVVGILIVVVLRGARPSWDRSWGTELYVGAVMVATLAVGARANGAAAYYLVIPHWAALVLGALLLRRLTRGLARPRLAFVVVAVLFAAAAITGYASLFTERSAWSVLARASSDLRGVGDTIKDRLGGVDVSDVSWLTEGQPTGFQYTIRGIGGPLAGKELWPWLVQDRDARPAFHALVDGEAGSWQRRAGEFSASGQVMVVLSNDYQLTLLVHEGKVLWP